MNNYAKDYAAINEQKDKYQEQRIKYFCEQYDLDEKLRDIYLVGNSGNKHIIIGVEGYRKIAHRSHPKLVIQVYPVFEGDSHTFTDGSMSTSMSFSTGKKLIGGCCAVQKSPDELFSYRFCSLQEYFKETSYKDGDKEIDKKRKDESNLWIMKPVTMISKVAEAQALRMVCPELNGTYSIEESTSMVGINETDDRRYWAIEYVNDNTKKLAKESTSIEAMKIKMSPYYRFDKSNEDAFKEFYESQKKDEKVLWNKDIVDDRLIEIAKTCKDIIEFEKGFSKYYTWSADINDDLIVFFNKNKNG